MTEPEVGTPSTVMQVLKQRTARALLAKCKRRNPRQAELFGAEPQRRAFWQARFYDFNVWTTKKRVEKLRYMHRNPVKRELVESPEQWRWSSYRFYLLGETGPVRVNEGWTEIVPRSRGVASTLTGIQNLMVQAASFPPLPRTQGRGNLDVGDASEIESLGHPPHR